MKSLTIDQETQIFGGAEDNCGVIGGIGAAACFGSMFWPIGTAMFGPTCGGMIIAAAVECP